MKTDEKKDEGRGKEMPWMMKGRGKKREKGRGKKMRGGRGRY
jgi:hypothetical protein